MTDLGSILRGDPLTGNDYRRALDEMTADGLMLVDRDTLAALRSAVTFDRLNQDDDLLAEVLVDLFSREPEIGTGRLELERAA